ncbi:hypothetical protein ACVXHA_06365 [Escherichia coli]
MIGFGGARWERYPQIPELAGRHTVSIKAASFTVFMKRSRITLNPIVCLSSKGYMDAAALARNTALITPLRR